MFLIKKDVVNLVSHNDLIDFINAMNYFCNNKYTILIV